MRKRFAVLVALAGSSCGDGVDIPVQSTNPPEVITANLDISGEWPQVAEAWFRADYSLYYYAKVSPNCDQIEGCVDGVTVEGAFEPDGSFAIPPLEAVCNSPPLTPPYLSVIGWVDPAYRNSECAIPCVPHVPPKGGPLECTSTAQFLSIRETFYTRPLNYASCLSPPPPPELHTIDIVMPAPKDLENATWTLNNLCGDQSIVSGDVPADADTLRITAEVICSEGYRLAGRTEGQTVSLAREGVALEIVGDNPDSGTRHSRFAIVTCTDQQQQPSYCQTILTESICDPPLLR